MPIQIFTTASKASFSEEGYLSANPDVAAAVKAGVFKSGLEHFKKHGQTEQRRMRDRANLSASRKRKMARIKPFLRDDMPFKTRNGKFDFLTEELRALAAIEDTTAVSSNGYDSHAMELVDSSDLVLDCGAGQRDVYFENVINFEIVDYDTTDVLGIGEQLPFKDATFDAVISIAVLEHVRDPFECAREIIRVLKPGGRLYCCVPFLQPLHGYPNHYYNMSHQGLKALFDHSLDITAQDVLPSTGPIWSLTWILQRWASSLPANDREAFEKMSVRELMSSPASLLDELWVRNLPKEAQFELASATVLFGKKPG